MSIVVALAGLAALVVAVARNRFRLITVVGRSMTPTLEAGDRVLVRVTRRPAAGDLVVFRIPASGLGLDWMIKRVTAVAGHQVPPGIPSPGPQTVVPAGNLVVRGDNPDSQDSRHFGFVPVATVLGVVVKRLG